MHEQKEKEEGKDQTGVKFSCFDVYSTRQGSLRLWAMFYSVLLLVFLGLYLTVGAVLNYNQEDADQRDMITNFRMFIGGRIQAHERNLENPFPEEATLPAVSFPPFAWDASLTLELTFKIAPRDMLHGAQVLNALPAHKRPRMAYTQTASDNDLISQVWTISANFAESMRAFEIAHDSKGTVTVRRVRKVLCVVRYTAIDVPATIIETDASLPQYRDGRPAFKLVEVEGRTESCGDPATFQAVPDCRAQAMMPHIHALSPLEFDLLYQGPLQGLAAEVRGLEPLTADVQVTVRDIYQPKPYAPLMTEFGETFFVGFSLLIGAIITLVMWCCLRFHVVIRNVRVNEGRPPMFYQGMLRFRGW